MCTTEISVIIPVFNGKSTVGNAVGSILENNPAGIEIILVDDHSSDGSRQLCDEIAAQHSFVKVISNERNLGVAGSRQRGLEACCGEFVTFCDQDDVVCAPYFSFIEKMRQSGADMLAANYNISYKGESHLSGEIENDVVIAGEKGCKYLAKGVLCKSYFDLEKPVLANTIWNCIFRRSLITEHHLSIKSFISYEDDWLFLIDSLSVAGTIALSAAPFYVWMVSDHSQSKQRKIIKNLPSRSLGLVLKIRKCARIIVTDKFERTLFICIFIKRILVDIIKNTLLMTKNLF